VVLDRALSGRIPVRLWAENRSDQPVLLCRPVDGSLVVDRDPAYLFRLVDGGGREVPRTDQDGCPWKNLLRDGDFVTVKPGQKVDLLGPSGTFGELSAYLFPNLQPGTYTLTLTYAMTGAGKLGGKPAGQPGANVPELLRKALRGKFTSNPVQVRFLPAPGTEELLQVLNGRKGQVLGPADALLVLGSRREPRGYRPALAALADQDRGVRRAAVLALREYAAAHSVGQLQDKAVIPPELLEALGRACKDADAEVREVAAICLRQAREMLAAAKEKR
jgi:hypothetical protein